MKKLSRATISTIFTSLGFNLFILFYFLEDTSTIRTILIGYLVQNFMMAIYSWLLVTRREARLEIEEGDHIVDRILVTGSMVIKTFFYFMFMHVGLSALLLLFLSFLHYDIDMTAIVFMVGGLFFHYISKFYLSRKEELNLEETGYILAVPYVRILPLFILMWILNSHDADPVRVMIIFISIKTIVEFGVTVRGNSINQVI